MNDLSDEGLVFSSAGEHGGQGTPVLKAVAGALIISVVMIVTSLVLTANWMGFGAENEPPNSSADTFTSQLSFRNDLAAHEVVAEGSPFPAESIDLPSWSPAEAFSLLGTGTLDRSLVAPAELIKLSASQGQGDQTDFALAQMEVHDLEPLSLAPREQASVIEHTVATLFLQIEGTQLKKLWPSSRARSFEIPQGLEVPTWPGVAMKVGVVGKTGLVEFCAPLDDVLSVENSRALTRWVKQLQFEPAREHLVWGEARIWQKQIPLSKEPSPLTNPEKQPK